MGVGFRRAQAARFKHQTSAAFDRFKVPTLLRRIRQDIFTVEYNCEPIGAYVPTVGAAVRLQQQGDTVFVVEGNRRVGQVEISDENDLGDALKIGHGLLEARVHSTSVLGGFFVVRLDKDK